MKGRAVTDIRHDAASRRFLAQFDDHTGHVAYEVADKVLVLTHTVVPDAIGGRGIAARLVQAALDHARSQGLQVEPRCSYADAWMRRHPEYEPLRA
jgi:predicted GNAT family acetyltransferase